MRLDSKLPHVGTTIFTVMSQLAAREQAINLGQGFPDFEGPPAMHQALTAAMAAGHNQYAPMTGIAPLRQEIALKTERLYGRAVDAEAEVTVTSGATEALFAAIHAVVRPGEEVIVFDPAYDSYRPAIELAGGVSVHLSLHAPDFAIDWDLVKAAITPRTRMILVNSPHNPTGAVLSAGDLDALAALVEGTDIVVLSVEVYEHIVFDDQPHQSVLRHDTLAARSFVVSSFGKTFHCTGWKLGYCIAPAALSAEFRKVHQYLTFCSFNPAQWAIAEVLKTLPEHYLELPDFYQAKRDLFAELLAESPFEILPVGGAYFQLIDYSRLSDEDDLSFCQRLTREAKVAAVPVSVFYRQPPPGQRLARLCFAKNDGTLSEAAGRLRDWALRQ